MAITLAPRCRWRRPDGADHTTEMAIPPEVAEEEGHVWRSSSASPDSRRHPHEDEERHGRMVKFVIVPEMRMGRISKK